MISNFALRLRKLSATFDGEQACKRFSLVGRLCGSLTVLGPSGVTGGWNLIHFGSYTGSFSSISLPPENPPMHWNVAYNVPQDYFRIWTSAY